MAVKRILVLSYFFPPDLSAGSFRADSIVRTLLERSHDCEVTVLTTEPNRYSSYVASNQAAFSDQRLTVVRVNVPNHSDSIYREIYGFLKYFACVLNYVRAKDFDVVFATSGRLMTAFLGRTVSWIKSVPIYLDIRDIFYEVVGDLFKGPKRLILLSAIKLVERFTFSNPDHVNLVSKGFSDYFSSNLSPFKMTFHTNGIDEAFLPTGSVIQQVQQSGLIKIVYAGNIGDGQDLHRILPSLANRLNEEVQFSVFGDGRKCKELMKKLDEQKIMNVDVFSPVNREDLVQIYSDADVLFLHLGDKTAFKRVLPSKLFEYAASAKPILAGVGGYASHFIQEEIKNAAVFPPNDTSAAVQALNSLKLENTDRSQFVKNFGRKRISTKVADEIIDLCK